MCSRGAEALLSSVFEGTRLGVTYVHSVGHLEGFLLLQLYVQPVLPLQAVVVSLKSTELICHLLPGFDQHHLKRHTPQKRLLLVRFAGLLPTLQKSDNSESGGRAPTGPP